MSSGEETQDIQVVGAQHPTTPEEQLWSYDEAGAWPEWLPPHWKMGKARNGRTVFVSPDLQRVYNKARVLQIENQIPTPKRVSKTDHKRKPTQEQLMNKRGRRTKRELQARELLVAQLSQDAWVKEALTRMLTSEVQAHVEQPKKRARTVATVDDETKLRAFVASLPKASAAKILGTVEEKEPKKCARTVAATGGEKRRRTSIANAPDSMMGRSSSSSSQASEEITLIQNKKNLLALGRSPSPSDEDD